MADERHPSTDSAVVLPRPGQDVGKVLLAVLSHAAVSWMHLHFFDDKRFKEMSRKILGDVQRLVVLKTSFKHLLWSIQTSVIR